ncbi:MAG: IS256 family transposase, partial [Pseudobdellovibrionaceae bacterium]|nr:IS256 family transposase [Pseudobdellovibrionaceae bacterium]
MSVIKIEIKLHEIPKAIDAFRKSRKKALDLFSEEIRGAVSKGFNQLLNTEIDLFLGDSAQNDNKRNGYQPEREYVLKGVGAIRVRVPKDRQGRFESIIIPPKERVDPRIRAEMAILQLAGLSSRTLSMISKRLLGFEASKDTINGSLALVEEEAKKWLDRPLQQAYWALYVDGTNFKVQRRGSTSREPALVVLGIDANNHRSILAIEPGTKDNVECWRAVFSSLKQRGLNVSKVRLGVMDGLPGLENLFKHEFPNAVTQRCWFHALGNSLAKAPARLREAFKVQAHKVMYAQSENEARIAFSTLKDLMDGEAGRAVKCLEKDLDSLLTFFKFDRSLWV